MALSNVGQLVRQTRALFVKNLLVVVARRPLGFLLLTYGIPLAILSVFLSIPSFLTSTSKFGVGSPVPIANFADTVHGKVVIIRPPNLGPDVDRVIDTLIKPLDRGMVQILQHEQDLEKACLANLRGVSDCHAAVSFRDSPETKVPVENPASRSNSTHTWQYVVRADPASRSAPFDALKHKSDQENLYLPLQLAVNNAIANSTIIPDVFTFTTESQEEQDSSTRKFNALLIGQTYTFALVVCYYLIAYRITAFITAERESGMSQLVGAEAALQPRDLPCFIAAGVLYKHIAFPSSHAGILILWQVLLGLAINNSAVFAAAFFKKSRVSAVYVVGALLLISIGAQDFILQDDPPPSVAGGYLLSLLFPSANHVFFAQRMCLWEVAGKGADLLTSPPSLYDTGSTGYDAAPAALLGLLALQIIVYPVLALLVERGMHGIDFRKRSFVEGPSSSSAVAETFDLKKKFVPNILERVFCCGTRKSVTAVDGVSLQGHKGQILCLVGPNGSGKTTTLHMISGFITPTDGSIKLNAAPSQIGVCPQRNTFWEELTVKEHISIWSQLKAGRESPKELEELASACELAKKRGSAAKTLSGGQKRKLQLACMFVGDSSICLVDECTSGLDPLSRRSIWEILLRQRSRRSIVFTTHFLDEVDVLADHIVILSKGKIRCQGAAAELKHRFGGGYKVLAPLSSTKFGVPYPSAVHQDSRVYTVPDSHSAAELSAQLEEAGVSDVAINGPQVEDVFLNVANEDGLTACDSPDSAAKPTYELTSGRIVSFWTQVGVLFRKRLTILRRFWWPYLYVLALPLIITPFLGTELLRGYAQPSCASLDPFIDEPAPSSLYYHDGCESCPKLAVAPPSARETVRGLVEKRSRLVGGVNASSINAFAVVQDGRKQWIDYVTANTKQTQGAVFMGSEREAPAIGFCMYPYGENSGNEILSLYSQMQSNVEILSAQGTFARPTQTVDNPGTLYAIFFTLLQAIYPAAFALYPAIEKARKVRALQYANGVRRGPLWVAYGLFDLMFVAVLAFAITAMISIQVTWNGPAWIMLPILILYGVAATLLGYVVAHFTSGPLTAFLTTAGIGMLMYIIVAIAFSVGSAFASSAQMDGIDLALTYGLNIVLPIGNVFRSMLLGLNVGQRGCKDGQPAAPGSTHAFGGPILYLVIQVAILLAAIIWLEGDKAIFRRRGKTSVDRDSEKTIATTSPEVQDETTRVENSETDLFRALHVSKSFGSNQALDNVTLGLPEGDVMALLGPNGAGKSTLVNIIQSELSADSGQALLKGEDVRTRAAQRYLGICPQYDALDVMNTRDHLMFYAKIKGIQGVKENVDHVMSELDLTPHAATLASKLSGGNKRKLSLAIALMGTPPVMVLDEPTSAMDAVAKRCFWRLIRKITPNRSVLLTTHSMEEADALATRAAIISRSILAVGTTRALREKHSNHYHVSLVLASAPDSPPEDMERARDWVLAHVPGAALERDMLGGQVRFAVPATGHDGRRPVGRLIALLEGSKQQLGVAYYSVGAATLESVFLSVVRENKVDDEDGAAHGRRGFFKLC